MLLHCTFSKLRPGCCHAISKYACDSTINKIEILIKNSELKKLLHKSPMSSGEELPANPRSMLLNFVKASYD